MKNKKISSLLFAAVFSSMVLTSCEDEVLVPVEDKTKVESLLSKIDSAGNAVLKIDAENNVLLIQNRELEAALDQLEEPVNTKIQYTVNVLSASNTIFSDNSGGSELRKAGVAGVPNVSIRLEQDGKSLTTTSTETGLAIFNNVKPGYANVFVSGADINHTDVEYTVYLGDGDNEEDTINAASQIVLFPTSGEKAATIKGTAFINLRADDDTLGRKYADSYANATLAGTYLSKSLVTGYHTVSTAVPGTVFEMYPDVSKIKYDMAAGRTVYAFPDLPTSAINNSIYSSDRGRITSISYKGAIVSAKVATDGTYALKVPTSDLGLDIRVEIEKIVADHTRLTRSASYYGQAVGTDLSGTGFETPASSETGTSNELGSVIVEYKNITARSNASTVSSTTITSVKRRVVTEQYVFDSSFSDSFGYHNHYSSYRDTKAGATITQNIYLQPSYLY